jgi:UDP-glucose 4-epimerase
MIRWFWRAANLNKNKFTNGNVLLTGATGFVGAFILQKLLQTQVIIIRVLIFTNNNCTIFTSILSMFYLGEHILLDKGFSRIQTFGKA